MPDVNILAVIVAALSSFLHHTVQYTIYGAIPGLWR